MTEEERLAELVKIATNFLKFTKKLKASGRFPVSQLTSSDGSVIESRLATIRTIFVEWYMNE